MEHAPTARRLGPDDAGTDHFVFVDQVSYDHQVDLVVRHAEFFECHLGRDEPDPPRFGQGPHTSIAVVKNVYNLTPIFVLNGGLVVNTAVRNLLAATCKVEFREVAIEKAFWFPYGPGNMSYQMAGINLEGRAFRVIDRFAAAYACPAPREKFYDVIVATGYLHGPRYSDLRLLRVATDLPEGFSVYRREARVSQQMIHEHGLVYVGGYACRPDVFELLNPYLHRPWFWTERYAYD